MVFLSLSLVLERKSNNTLERFHSRRRPEEDPKENDKSKKKRAFLLCRDDLRRRRLQKKKECVLWHLLISVESIEEAHKAREREKKKPHKKRNKIVSKKEISHI